MGSLTYRRDLFDAFNGATLGRPAASPAGIGVGRARPVGPGELPLLLTAERQAVLVEWSGEGGRIGCGASSLHGLFEEQVERRSGGGGGGASTVAC